MTRFECPFESEVLEAVLHDRWDHDLREHVAGCAICSDIATISAAIDAGRDQAPDIPDSGRVWWLAQHRARLEAAAAANRPMTAAQVIALVCAAGLLGTYLPSLVTWLQSTWIPSATGLLLRHGALAIAMAAVLLLLPAAVYFAMGRD
jgi:hypothetical protein